jgi:putative ABC transport system ATP-binding protein
MGPSGSGKSTLLHCMAGLDRRRAGSVRIGDTDITELKENELTRLRRDRHRVHLPGLQPDPDADRAENIELPLRLAGRKPDRAPGSTPSSTPSACATASTTGRPSCPVASSSGSPPPGPSPPDPTSSSPTSPPGNLDSRSGAELLGTAAALRPRSARPS